MKSNFKLICISMMLFTVLYVSSTDLVLADHKIGDDVIHKDLYELKVKSSPPGLHIAGSGIYEENSWVVIGTAQEEWGAYEFVRWTVNGEWVDGNPINVLMDKDVTAIATYSIHPVQSIRHFICLCIILRRNRFIDYRRCGARFHSAD